MALQAPDPSSLPPQVQLFAYIGAGVAAVFLSIYGYFFKGRKSATEDFVIAGADLADAKPLRDLAASAQGLLALSERSAVAQERSAAAHERIAGAAEAIRELFEREADEEERLRVIRDEVAQEFARHPRAPGHRQRKPSPHR
ncbi:hypothetical protein [Kaistia sp. MMO-174]|uniref:hypothetical protein n=1 Tax=Kaistia sp. MMO-174 TaxID=3081256 RepID=UPI0030180385